MVEFFSEGIHTAAKDYKCDICGCEISKGERYYRIAEKYEGKFLDICQHIHCRNMADEYCRRESENEYDSDIVADYINDHYCLDCEKHPSNEPEDDTEYENWTECDCSVYVCPKLKALFSKEMSSTKN